MPERTRPNILLITTDQQRFDALGINGNKILNTPNLDSLARTGVNFSRAYVTCPICIPARRTLISGQSPTTHGLRAYRDGLEFNPAHTLPGVLGRHGWQTQLVGKLHLHPQRKRFGFDHMVLSETPNYRPDSPLQSQNDYAKWLRSQGIHHHPNFHGIDSNGRLARPFPLDEAYHHNTWLAQEAVAFITERRDPACPWFLHLSFTHPHPPFTPPRDYLNKYMRRFERLSPPVIGSWANRGEAAPGLSPRSPTGPFDPEEIREAKAGYYALINHIDDCIAYVLDRIFEYGHPRGEEPLWILFSSDHGEMLGDHHLFRKGLPFEGSAHVPFFLSGRNVELQSGTVDDLVCWEDIMPTLLDLAGVPIPPGLDGDSLAGAVRGKQIPKRDRLFEECGNRFPHYSIITGPWKYIFWRSTNEEQLFHLFEDPEETEDRSGSEDLTPFREMLSDALHQRGESLPPFETLVPVNNSLPAALL